MRLLLAFAFCAAALPLGAQPARFSLGPQLSTLGVGAAGAYRLSPRFSVSAEAGVLPAVPIETTVDGIAYDGDGRGGGGVLLVNLHPGGGSFSVGAGLFVGGYGLKGTARPDGPIEIGGETYQPDEVGRVEGDFSVRGPVPVLVLGWRGAGFNLGVGVTPGHADHVALEAFGPAASRQDVQESVARERQDIKDQLRDIPVIPYLRLGWQFGF